MVLNWILKDQLLSSTLYRIKHATCNETVDMVIDHKYLIAKSEIIHKAMSSKYITTGAIQFVVIESRNNNLKINIP